MDETKTLVTDELRGSKISKGDDVQDTEGMFILRTLQKDTTLLIACVSAILAIFSFAMNFIVERANMIYLAYWNIDRSLASGNNAVFLHSLICSLIYLIALATTHVLMSATADTFQHYYKLVSLLKFCKNIGKKYKKKYKRIERAFLRILTTLEDDQKESSEAESISRELLRVEQQINTELDRSEIKEALSWYGWWLFGNVTLHIVFAFIIVTSSLLIEKNLINWTTLLKTIALSGIIILMDVALYFGIAVYRARVTPQKFETLDIPSYMKEIKKIEKYQFPLVSITTKAGIKRTLSDRNLKILFFQIALVGMMFMASSVYLGQTTATSKNQFPVYTDNENTYAIVHINDDNYIMLNAQVDDNTITIDTSKQRILTTDDISYNLMTFQTVTKVETGGDIP